LKKRVWEYNGGGELVQITLYMYMESLQLNHLVLLMYTNSKI
jgi:hypothetical protein